MMQRRWQPLPRTLKRCPRTALKMPLTSLERYGPPIHHDGSNNRILIKVTESVKTGLWVGDCFIYTNSVNRLNYYVGGEIVTVSHLDRTM